MESEKHTLTLDSGIEIVSRKVTTDNNILPDELMISATLSGKHIRANIVPSDTVADVARKLRDFAGNLDWFKDE